MLPIYNNVPTGSGPAVKYEKKTTNFDAFSNKAYQLDMVDGISKEIKILSGSDNDWLILDMSKWKRGLDGLTVTLNFNPQPLTNGETTFSKYIVDRPCVIHYRNLDGRWFIESAVGMDGNYLSLERAISDLTNKKFDWKAVKPLPDPKSLSFTSNAFYSFSELIWAEINDTAIAVSGIIRMANVTDGARQRILTLPDNMVTAHQIATTYLPCGYYLTTKQPYCEIASNSRDIWMDSIGVSLPKDAAIIVNWVIPVRKVR